MKRIISLLFTCLATTMAAWTAGHVSFNTGGNYCKVAFAEYDTANDVIVQNIAEFPALLEERLKTGRRMRAIVDNNPDISEADMKPVNPCPNERFLIQ